MAKPKSSTKAGAGAKAQTTRASTKPVPLPAVEEPAGPKPISRKTIACAGCGGLCAVLLVVGIIVISIWDARDNRLYDGKPLPSNVARIGGWVTDKVVAARLDTCTPAGNRLACDFSVRNDSQQEITVQAIGRSLVAQPAETLLGLDPIPASLGRADNPMAVTDNDNVLVLLQDVTGQLVGLPTSEPPGELPQGFTLKPGEARQIRYRPTTEFEAGVQRLRIAAPWAVRIAVMVSGDPKPHAFYFLRRSAGIGGLFEKTIENAVQPR